LDKSPSPLWLNSLSAAATSCGGMPSVDKRHSRRKLLRLKKLRHCGADAAVGTDSCENRQL
jgi:hypothetical protein